jgi:hypothetical protein
MPRVLKTSDIEIFCSLASVATSSRLIHFAILITLLQLRRGGVVTYYE